MGDEVWLIISAVIISALILFVVIYLLVTFGHPDDKNGAWLPKIIVVFGLWLASASVLAMPYDVANSRGEGAGLRIDILWQIIYIALALMISLVIPYAYFYYENDQDPDQEHSTCDTQACHAFRAMIVFFVVFIIFLLIAYSLLNNAEIPVRIINKNASELRPIARGIDAFKTECVKPTCASDTFTWVIPVTFPVYVMAFLGFFGWFLFTVFCGVGLVALPMDLINEFITRPIYMPASEYYKKQKELGERAKKLLEVAEAIKTEQEDEKRQSSWNQRRKDRQTFNKFEQHFYMLKKDRIYLDACHKLKGGNPLWYFMKLILGVIGVAVSLSWFIHICLYVLPQEPATPFLNNFFIALESVGNGNFPLFGIVAFAMWSFYLLWATIKGNFKIGLRLFIFRMFPMELGNTMMNSFLANTWLILICSVPTVQLCVAAFPVYARYTAVDLLFGTQIQYLQFASYFFRHNVFIIALLCFCCLSAIWLFMWPKDKAAAVEEELKAIDGQEVGLG